MSYTNDLWLLKMGLKEKPVKEKKPIAKMSAKRKEENKTYKKQVKAQAKKDNRCKVKSPDCTGKMQGFHHAQKRSPGNLLKEDNQIPCCNACNLYLELHTDWAKANGFLISRFAPSVLIAEKGKDNTIIVSRA